MHVNPERGSETENQMTDQDHPQSLKNQICLDDEE